MGGNSTTVKWVVFAVYVSFSLGSYALCTRMLYCFWQARHAKPIAIRMPLLGLINFAVACFALINGYFGILEQIVGHVISERLSIAIAGFWLVFFPVMAMTISWHINWQYSVARVEAEKVWKSELELQVSQPLVIHLTPIMRSWHGTLGTAMLTTVVLYSVIVIPLVVSVSIIQLSTLIAISIVFVAFIALTAIIAYQTSRLGNTYGLRQEFKYLLWEFVLMVITHVLITRLFRPLSFAHRIVLNTRNCFLITIYVYITAHLSVQNLRSMQQRKQKALQTNGDLLTSSSQRINNSLMLRRVLKDYESFVLLTEYCVTEMSVEGILFVVWYMRAKQRLYSFLRNCDMFDYDSAFEQCRLHFAKQRSLGKHRHRRLELRPSDLVSVRLLQDVLYYHSSSSSKSSSSNGTPNNNSRSDQGSSKLTVMNSLRGLHHIPSMNNLSLDLTGQIPPLGVGLSRKNMSRSSKRKERSSDHMMKKKTTKKKKKKPKHSFSLKQLNQETLVDSHSIIAKGTAEMKSDKRTVTQHRSLPMFGQTNSDSVMSSSRITFTEVDDGYAHGGADHEDDDDNDEDEEEEDEEELFSGEVSTEQHVFIESPRSSPVRMFRSKGMTTTTTTPGSVDDNHPAAGSLGHLLKNLRMQTRSDLLLGDNLEGIRSQVPSPRAGAQSHAGFRSAGLMKGPDLLSVSGLYSSNSDRKRSSSARRLSGLGSKSKKKTSLKLSKKGGSIDQYMGVSITVDSEHSSAAGMNGCSPSLKFFSEIGTVVCLPREIIDVERVSKVSTNRPSMKLKHSDDTTNVKVELSTTDLTTMMRRISKDGSKLDHSGGEETEEECERSKDEERELEEEEHRRREQMKGIVDVLHRILRDFLSMDGIHSVNVSNDCRVSALKYVRRLNQILEYTKDDNDENDGAMGASDSNNQHNSDDASPSVKLVGKHNHQSSGPSTSTMTASTIGSTTVNGVGLSSFFNYQGSAQSPILSSPDGSGSEMTLSKRVRIILKCVLCLDRVLNEIIRVLKVDSFQRFLETDQFKQWQKDRQGNGEILSDAKERKSIMKNATGLKTSDNNRSSKNIGFTRITTRSTSSSSSVMTTTPIKNTVDSATKLPPQLSLPQFRKST